MHRRMVRREPVRPRVLLDVGDPHRAPLGDEEPQDPVADRRGTELGPDLIGDALREETLDAQPILREHAERAVPRARESDGQLHDPLEDGVEVKLGRERHACLDQHPVAGAFVWHRAKPTRPCDGSCCEDPDRS